jgi:hypothetical protein
MAQLFGTFLYGDNNLVSAHSLLLMKTDVAQPPSAVGVSFGFLLLAKYEKPRADFPANG